MEIKSKNIQLSNRNLILGFLFMFFVIFNSCDSGYTKTKNYFKEEMTYHSNGRLETTKRFEDFDDSLTYYIKYYYDNGILKCEGQINKTQKTGKWKYYTNNKIILRIENFNDGLLTDTQAYYYPSGDLDILKILETPIECFCDTQSQYSFSQVKYWRNGQIREINHIKNCMFDGKTQIYDSLTGCLKLEFFESLGQKNGSYKEFNSDSSITIGNCKNGRPIGIWKTIKGNKIISANIY